MGKSGLLLLAVAFAAGGGIGFVAGTGTSGGEPSGVGDGPVLDAPRGPSPEPRRETSPLPEGVRRSLTAWIEGFPLPEIETGNGVITGFARAEDGSPLPGVLIRGTRQAHWGRGHLRGGGPPEEPDLEKIVRDRVERVLLERASRTEAVTASDGSYRLTGLADTTHSVTPYLEGYHFERRGNAYRVKPGGKVDFVGKPVVRVPLTVLEPGGGTPESSVMIMCKQGNRQDAQYWTAELGALALSPGAWTIRAVHQDSMQFYGRGGGRTSDEVQLVLEVGVKPAPVTLKLEDRPGIKGRVVFPPGDANSNCQVSAMKITAGKDPDPDRLASGGQQVFVHSQMGGEFFLELPAGTYLVGLVTNQRKVVTSRTVEVTSGVTEVTLEFPEPDPEDSLVVRVEGPDGKLVGEATFTGGYQSSTSRSGGSTVRSVRQADGTFRVDHGQMDRDKEKADGRYWLEVTTSRYGAQRVEYVRDATQDLTVRFEHPATLAVTVEGYATSDFVGNIQLSVAPKEEGSARRSPMRFMGGFPGQSGLNAEGVQSFGPLAPGSYVITVGLKRQQWQFLPIATHDVVLKSGANSQSVPLPALYILTVTVDGAKDGTTLRMSPAKRTGPWRYFSSSREKVKDGRVVFENLPAGEYRISASGGGVRGKMTVTLPGPATVRFVAEATYPAYLVRITNPEGRFAQAGLKSGDYIIGVNGQDFADTKQMAALMSAAQKMKSSALNVLRGSSRLVVELDLTATGLGNAAAGGRIYPTTR